MVYRRVKAHTGNVQPDFCCPWNSLGGLKWRGEQAKLTGLITPPEFQWSLKISSLNHNSVGYIAYRRNAKSYFYSTVVPFFAGSDLYMNPFEIK